MNNRFKYTGLVLISFIIGACSNMSTKYIANLHVNLNREMPKSSLRIGIMPFSDERKPLEKEKGIIRTRNTFIPLWFLLFENKVKEYEYHFTPEVLSKSVREWLTQNSYNALFQNSIFSPSNVMQLTDKDSLTSIQELCKVYNLNIVLKGHIHEFDSYSRYTTQDLWVVTSTGHSFFILPGEAKLEIEIELFKSDGVLVWKRMLMGSATNDYSSGKISIISIRQYSPLSPAIGVETREETDDIIQRTTYKSAYDGTSHAARIVIEQYLNALLKDIEKVLKIWNIGESE